ncbi:MAG: thiamine diphosphokinase [Bacteroidales bacterium]|nr:thiamine diphosphokinase [Bacteroidales bacterium]
MVQNDNNMMMNIFDFKPDIVILGGGNYPTHSIPLSILNNAKRVQCCDGAANEFINRGKTPWRIIGDGDSISSEIKSQLHDIIRIFPDQETNDQTKNIIYAKNHGFNNIAIVGATGKREDHTIGNISLLLEYQKLELNVRIFTDCGMFMACKDKIQFNVNIGSQISIFNYDAKDLTANGLKYPIRSFTAAWQGTLNEATENNVTIYAKGIYIVFINY